MIEFAKARGRMRWRILLALAAVAAVFLSAHVATAEATADGETSSVNVVYFHPNDIPPDQPHIDAIQPMMAEIQAWVARELGGKTFSFSATKVVQGLQPASYYQEFVWGNVLTELAARKLAPDACSGPVFGTSPYSVLVVITSRALAVNGSTPCGGLSIDGGVTSWYAGDGGGLAMFTEQALDFSMGLPVNWWENTGWPAHEMLHGLTLPHPRACELDSTTVFTNVDGSNVSCADAVMFSAHAFPEGHLLDTPEAPEKATLLQHPLLDTVLDISGSEPIPEADCPDLACTEDPTEPAKKGKGKGWGRGGKPRP